MALDVQTKVFSRWMNIYVPHFSGDNFIKCIQDGPILIELLTRITNDDFPSLDKYLNSRGMMLLILKILKEKYQITIEENIFSDNISEIHKFLWTIISRLVITPHTSQLKEFLLFDNCELALLQWCRNQTFGYKGVDVVNFTTSWSTGLAFNAIINKHHPSWFDYKLLLNESNQYNLDHAFKIAEERLSVKRLLDVEDMDAELPDHKSVVLYLVTLLDQLTNHHHHHHHHSLPFENIKKHDKVSPPNSPTHPVFATLPPTDVSNFVWKSEKILYSLEVDLHDLLKRSNIPMGLDILRDQFHEHEKLMARLTERQETIGEMSLGRNDPSVCSTRPDDRLTKRANGVMERIKEVWEELRTKAVKRQNDLHSLLMKGQQEEINKFSSRLYSFENKLRELRRRPLEDKINNKLKDLMEPLQREALNVQSMLLVVDETNSHLPMEIQLEHLGRKWLEVCNEVELFELFLVKLKNGKEIFDLELSKFKDWLSQTEDLIGGIIVEGEELEDGEDVEEMMMKQVKCLKMIENTMEEMMDEFQQLNKHGLMLSASSGEDESMISFINDELQTCQERWYIIVDKMESASKNIPESDVVASFASDDGSDLYQVASPGNDTHEEYVDKSSMFKCPSTPRDVDLFRGFKGFSKMEVKDETSTSKVMKRRSKSKMRRSSKHFDSSLRDDIVRLVDINKRGSIIAGSSISKKMDEEDLPVDKHGTSSSMEHANKVSMATNVGRLKREFDEQVISINQWLDKAEVTQDMLTSDSHNGEQTGLTIHEQSVLLEDAEKDFESHSKQMTSLQLIEKLIREEFIKSNKATEPIEEAIDSIGSRWDILLTSFQRNKKHLKSLETKNKFADRLRSIEQSVNEYNGWIDARGEVSSEKDFSSLSRLLEQNKAKMKALHSHGEELDNLKATIIDCGSTGELIENVEAIEGRFKVALSKMEGRQNMISEILNHTPSKSFCEALLHFKKWLDKMDAMISSSSSSSSSSITINFVEEMQKDIENLEGLVEMMHSRLDSLDYFDRVVKEMEGKMDGSERNQIFDDVDHVNCRWMQLKDFLLSKINRSSVAIEKVTEFEVHCEELYKWLNEMESYLTDEVISKADTELLKARINEKEGLMEDIKTMEMNISSMNEVVANFCSNASSEFAKKLRTDQEDINNRWKQICNSSKQQYETLRTYLSKLENSFVKLDLLTRWMDGSVKIENEYEISSTSDLAAHTDNFKALLHEFKGQRSDQLLELQMELEAIKDESNDDDDDVGNDNDDFNGGGDDRVNIFRTFKSTRTKFHSLQTRVEILSKRFANCGRDYDAFSDLMKRETSYMEDLKSTLIKLKHPNSFDSNELLAKQKELESILNSKSDENFSDVVRLSQDLTFNNIMADEVNRRLEIYLEDHKDVHAEAEQTLSDLCDLISKSNEIENNIKNISEWLADADDILIKEKSMELEEGQKMKHDFETIERILRKSQNEVERIKIEGKFEDVSKLETTIQMLFKHSELSEINFYKQQKPFGEKLIQLKQKLESFDLQLKTKVKYSSEDGMRDEIDRRAKIHNLMSGMKPEIEDVIKNGRKIIDKRLTQNPHLFASQLDDLKKFYNAIGHQVISQRCDLEELQKIKKGHIKIIEWTEDLNKELDVKRRTIANENIDSLNIWIRSKVVECTRMASDMTSLKSSFHQHSTNVAIEGSIDLQDVTMATIRSMHQKLEDLKMVVKSEEDRIDTKHDEFTDIQLKLLEQLSEVVKKYNETKSIELFVVYRDNLLESLSECRSLAEEINMKSSKFSQSIDLKAKEVNRKWRDLSAILESVDLPLEIKMHEHCEKQNDSFNDISDLNSVYKELEELNVWMNKLELITQSSSGPNEVSSIYLKNDFDIRVNKLSDLEMGVKKQRRLNKESEDKLQEHFDLTKMRMKVLEQELFGTSRGIPSNEKIISRGRFCSANNFEELPDNLDKLGEFVDALSNEFESRRHEGHLLSDLPLQSLMEEKEAAENLYNKAKNKLNDTDNASTNEKMLNIRTSLDAVELASVDTLTKDEIISTKEDFQSWLIDSNSKLTEPVNIFVRDRLLQSHRESDNLLKRHEELRGRWWDISNKIFASKPRDVEEALGVVGDCNKLTNVINKMFMKVSRRRLILEKYLHDVETNLMELNSLGSMVVQAQEVLHNNSSYVDAVRLMADILQRGQSNHDRLHSLVTSHQEESDVIKMATGDDDDDYDVESKLRIWASLRNQVKALDGLEKVLRADSLDEPNDDRQDVEKNDTGQSSFEKFVACLEAEFKSWPDGDDDDVLKNLISSINKFLKASRSEVTICDVDGIKRSLFALEDGMKDVEKNIFRVRSKCSESTSVRRDTIQLEYLISIEERLKYCHSECHLTCTRRNIDLEDVAMESIELNSLIKELNGRMDELMDEIAMDDGEVWMMRCSQDNLDDEIILLSNKIHSFKSRADDIRFQFSMENSSLLLQNIQSIDDRWRELEFQCCKNVLKEMMDGTNQVDEENELEGWMDGMMKELSSIDTVIPEDFDGLKVQIEELEKLRTKIAMKESEITNFIQQSSKFDKVLTDQKLNDHHQNFLPLNSLFHQILNEKSHLVEKATRHQDTLAGMNRSLKRLNSIVLLWKPLLHPTWNQLETELSNVKLVQNEVASLKTQLVSLINPHGGDDDDVSRIYPEHQNKDIKDRISILERSLDDKMKILDLKFGEICPYSDTQLSMTVSYPWERSLTDGEYSLPYYINHSQEKTQWLHPEMASLLNDLSSTNDVKFSAYRMALKLRMVQRKLSFDKVSIEDVNLLFRENSKSFAKPNLTTTDSLHLLSDMFERLGLSKSINNQHFNRGETMSQNLDICIHSMWIELVLNCLSHIFDSNKTGQIQGSCFKIFLIILSSGCLQRKYEALYSASSSSSSLSSSSSSDANMSFEELTALIIKCLQFPKQLGEESAFPEESANLTASSCLEQSDLANEVNRKSFSSWIKMEPQSLVWLAVHDRLCVSEGAIHDRRCNVCKKIPIVGLRYTCLKCFNFDLCQNCFFRGISGGKGHKLSHPIQEYYSATSSTDNMKYFTKMFRNKLRSKRYFKTHRRLGYLPVPNSNTTTRCNTLERSQPSKRSEFLEDRTVADVESRRTRSLSVDGIHSPMSPTCSADVGDAEDDGGCGDDNDGVRKEDIEDSKGSGLEGKTLSEAQNIVELCTSRLAEIENERLPQSLDWSDEHNLIAQYCRCLRDKGSIRYLQSPVDILMSVEDEYKSELEISIKELEDESRLLKKEYNDLKKSQAKSSCTSKSEFRLKQKNIGEDQSEVKQSRMERIDKRLKINEQQNLQLQQQLKQLDARLKEESDRNRIPSSRLVTSDSTPPSASSTNPPHFQQVSTRSNNKDVVNSMEKNQSEKFTKDKFARVTGKSQKKKS